MNMIVRPANANKYKTLMAAGGGIITEVFKKFTDHKLTESQFNEGVGYLADKLELISNEQIRQSINSEKINILLEDLARYKMITDGFFKILHNILESTRGKVAIGVSLALIIRMVDQVALGGLVTVKVPKYTWKSMKYLDRKMRVTRSIYKLFLYFVMRIWIVLKMMVPKKPLRSNPRFTNVTSKNYRNSVRNIYKKTANLSAASK